VLPNKGLARSRARRSAGVVWLAGVESTAATQYVESSRQDAAVDDAAVEGIPGPRSSRMGCDAAGRGMVTGIGQSALWRGVGPLLRRFLKPRPYAHGPDLPCPGLLLAAGLDVGPVLGCLRLANRVPLASSTIADLARRSRHCAAAGGSRPPVSTGGSIAWRERHGGLLPGHRQICCENKALEFSHTARSRPAQHSATGELPDGVKTTP
jgi:hypothetical protein